MLFLTRDRRALITDSRYTEAASQETDFEVIEENRGHRRTAILRELFSETGAEAAGYEDQSLRCSEFAVLRNALPEVKHWIPPGRERRLPPQDQNPGGTGIPEKSRGHRGRSLPGPAAPAEARHDRAGSGGGTGISDEEAGSGRLFLRYHYGLRHPFFHAPRHSLGKEAGEGRFYHHGFRLRVPGLLLRYDPDGGAGESR